MADEWIELPFSEAVLVNPPVRLERGQRYPFVDMGAVNPDSRWAYATEEREFSGGGARFQHGDTLMARITPCLENRKIARYCAANRIGDAHGSTEFIVIRGRSGVTDTEFAYYLTQWEEVRNYAISQMTGTSGRQRVPTDSLNHLTILVPPLPEQRAIAHILGTLDDKIELNRRMNETLEQMARALFKSWFVDFDPVRAKAEVRPTGLPTEIDALFPDSFEGSGLGEIPRGWRIKPLEEIATFLNGLALQKYPPPGDDYLPVIKIAELRSGITSSSGKASQEIPQEYIVEDGDVLFSWSGSLEVIIWCGGKGALNQHLFKVFSESYPKWFYYFWTLQHLPDFRLIAEGKATTMGHIQRRHLSEAKTIEPPTALLKIGTQQIGKLLDLKIEINIQSRTLAAIRDALLPKLMSGKMRVVDAEKFLKERGL